MRHHDDSTPDDEFGILADEYEELAARERECQRSTSPRSLMVD
jgi:hypothetical protein